VRPPLSQSVVLICDVAKRRKFPRALCCEPRSVTPGELAALRGVGWKKGGLCQEKDSRGLEVSSMAKVARRAESPLSIQRETKKRGKRNHTGKTPSKCNYPSDGGKKKKRIERCKVDSSDLTRFGTTPAGRPHYKVGKTVYNSS